MVVTSSSALLLLLVVVVVLLFGHQEASAKTVSGQFSSQLARQSHGQFITSFMYQGASGVLVVRVDSARLALQKESRVLLYVPDMTDEGLDNLSCSDRLTKAQLTVSLSEEETNQSIPRQYAPTAWKAVYVDRYTCQEGEVSLSQSDQVIRFSMVALNADSAGNPLDHFSAEEAGLHSFYFVLVLAYFVASCVYVQPLGHALKKGGPMHAVLKVLSTALALQIGHALCCYAHLARYSRDGVGIPLMGSLAELCDYISQSSMLYMLISLCAGWTLSRGRKPQSRPLQWDSSPSSTALAVGGVTAQAVLLLWEQYWSWDSEQQGVHAGVHGQRSVPGVLLMVLRVGLALLLVPVLYQITCTERSALKRDFYLCFAKGCFLWFLCHPVLVFISVVFNEHQRMKVVTIGVILCQSISMVTLYQLFLSRSLYWEVSSLSSVSLPLTMRGRY